MECLPWWACGDTAQAGLTREPPKHLRSWGGDEALPRDPSSGCTWEDAWLSALKVSLCSRGLRAGRFCELAGGVDPRLLATCSLLGVMSECSE